MTQFLMALFGLTSMAFALSNGPRRRAWAPMIGLYGQPAWAYFAYQTTSWGLGLLVTAYTLVHQGDLHQREARVSESIAIARLRTPTQAWQEIIRVWKVVKGWLIGNGGELEIDVRKATRSSKQNRLLHAMLGDIARQKEWAGQKRDTETWKRLLTAAWCRARNEHIEMLPALDGHGVDIVFRRTSQLSRAECAELCDYIGAWCAANGVKLKEARQWTDEEIDAETGEIMEYA